MDGAALPGTAQQLRDRVLQAHLSVGDGQLDAVQAALAERAQERPTECFGLGLADVQPISSRRPDSWTP